MPRRGRRGRRGRRERTGPCPNQLGKAPRARDDALRVAENWARPNRDLLMELLRDFDYDAFWSLRRKEQVVHLVLAADENVVTRADIAAVMGIAPCSVTRYVQRYEVHPDDLYLLPGRPNALNEVFDDIKDFINGEMADKRSVTLDVLMEFLTDEKHVVTTRRSLWEYLTTGRWNKSEWIKSEWMNSETIPEFLIEVHAKIKLPDFN